MRFLEETDLSGYKNLDRGAGENSVQTKAISP